MKKQIETEVKVGIFVSIGLGLLMMTLLMLGGGQNMLTAKNKYTSHFTSVEGLIVGAKVILAGVPVGIVEKIQFNKELRNIEIEFSVVRSSGDWLHQGASLEIATQGVLGDKYINIEGGNPSEPVLPPHSDIPPRPSKDFSQFLSKGDQLILTLNGVLNSLDRTLKSFETDHRNESFFKGITQSAKNIAAITDKMNTEVDQLQLKSATQHLNQILAKIDDGTGTIGALINDPSLYEDLRSLLGGVNRNRIMRNLVRQTIKDTKMKDAAQDAAASKN